MYIKEARSSNILECFIYLFADKKSFRRMAENDDEEVTPEQTDLIVQGLHQYSRQ